MCAGVVAALESSSPVRGVEDAVQAAGRGLHGIRKLLLAAFGTGWRADSRISLAFLRPILMLCFQYARAVLHSLGRVHSI
jgi:hypothetical protein